MQHFYDGQIRRYLTQTIRVLSNFVVKYGDGSLVRIPVIYGDQDRQAANIIRQNTASTVSSVPRIGIYISGLDLDASRLGDSSFIGKMHIRERGIDADTNQYTQGQGRNYTVERLMPTPFKLTMKADIWTANTDQKLQVLEQILVLFNPTLEIQTTDNYIDWTSLSVLSISSMSWSSRTVPVGADTPIDIATITFEAPIWISPPVKVKHLGVVTSIINSIYRNTDNEADSYIDGLGQPMTSGTTSLTGGLTIDVITAADYVIQVYNGQGILLSRREGFTPREPTLEIPVRGGAAIAWTELFDKYSQKYVAGSSMIYLVQPNGTEVVGTFAVNPLDETQISITWDDSTFNPNDLLVPTGIEGNRANGMSAGTFDAIINPQKVYPGHGMQNVEAGDRFLIIDDIGSEINQDGPDAWKNNDGTDFVALANDIIEWDGEAWIVVFNAQEYDGDLYQTNIYSGIQYYWNNVMWKKAFEGEYGPGSWRIEL